MNSGIDGSNRVLPYLAIIVIWAWCLAFSVGMAVLDVTSVAVERIVVRQDAIQRLLPWCIVASGAGAKRSRSAAWC